VHTRQVRNDGLPRMAKNVTKKPLLSVYSLKLKTFIDKYHMESYYVLKVLETYNLPQV